MSSGVVTPELIAAAGVGLAAVGVSRLGLVPDYYNFNLEGTIKISVFLFLAAVVASTGLLSQLAEWIGSWSEDPLVLVLMIMVLTAGFSGLFSAGPAAAAMLPVVEGFVQQGAPLHACQHWVAVGFAAGICAGSSLFVWSATSGLLLAEKVESAELRGAGGEPLSWGIRAYLRFGAMHFAVQLLIGVVWVLTAIHLAR